MASYFCKNHNCCSWKKYGLNGSRGLGEGKERGEEARAVPAHLLTPTTSSGLVPPITSGSGLKTNGRPLLPLVAGLAPSSSLM